MRHPRNRGERRAVRARHDSSAKLKAKGWNIAHRWWVFRHQDTNCSCHMCGNPRRHWNLPTIQERIAAIREEDCYAY